MKIGVISDSHGSISGAKRAIQKMGEVDYLIHLGDYCRDAERISKELKRDIIYVKGNCDLGSDVETDKVIEVGGKKIFLTHGHKYNVKFDYMDLYYKAEEIGVDAVLFGHTHFAEVFEKNGILFINPGSVSRPRNGIETYGVITVDGGNIVPNIVELY
ncbi:MAG: metallophosphoesterase [Candidatus Afipia apatlaquensis]|uniref:Phosphoesterase n=1 Tax=Candidatus Afipia apatlaquensis TaxID=2712852 RepID=A0A7C9VNF3_9BRAD|nr:metallophosphoesterase [Candidatus Afipia apatlaquensis]